MRAYGLGWRLVFVAGFFPAIAGSAMLALALWSVTLGQNDPWNSLMGQHDFSAAGPPNTMASATATCVAPPSWSVRP